MFDRRDLDSVLETIRESHAPGALVFECDREFETLPDSALTDLASRVSDLSTLSYPADWLPPEPPGLLARIAGPDLVIGYPEHGSVTWTRQTEPPVVLVRPRVRGSPAAFVDFLLAEAFVEVGGRHPEHFLGFFEGRYRELATGPTESYQLAAALFDGYVGLHTRDVFAAWVETHPRLHDAWRDAGTRLESRVADLPGAMGRGDTSFADATELACSAVKHGLELPAPFDALDTTAYRDHGADYAVEWLAAIRGADGDN